MPVYDVYVAPLDTPFPETVATEDGQEFVVPAGFIPIGKSIEFGPGFSDLAVTVDLTANVPTWDKYRVLLHRTETLKQRATDGGPALLHEAHIIAEAEAHLLNDEAIFVGQRFYVEPTPHRAWWFGPGIRTWSARQGFTGTTA